ncbi:hypothetical protein ZIOFF_047661 [Zingiber officinale]|uniref:Uncharacterized protein n=1 Tax=Zingiber officinale TaxID=94328 RepID=A0A8J5FXR2_ZINOF|nr:hypothetical protein ZIOFF_047661 [Zingiber officinale]
MRGDKELAVGEKALVTEAKERLVVMCEVAKPKDLVSTEAVRVVAEDLGLNRSKDLALGFPPPRMSIAEKLMLTKKKMELSKETNVHSSVHSSQQLPVSVGAKSKSRGTIASAENPPQKIPTISSMQSPSVAAVSRFSQPNKLLYHTSIRSEGIAGANASQSSHQMKNQEIKSSTVQARQGGLHITHQPTQGLAFFHPPSLYTNHNEIDTESLLVYDACEKGNHLKCLQSYGSKDIPKAEWHCPSCLASSNGKTLPPKYGRVTRAPVPAPRAAPNTSINVATKKTEDLDPNTSRWKALANNNSYVSQHFNSSNLGGSHYDSMVIGAEMDSRTNGVKRDNEKCDAVDDHLEETNGSVCANSDASCGLQISSTPELKLMKCGSSGLNAC